MRLHLFRKQPPAERHVTLSFSTSEQTDLIAACLLAIAALQADAKLVETIGLEAIGWGSMASHHPDATPQAANFYLLKRARELETIKNRILHAEAD